MTSTFINLGDFRVVSITVTAPVLDWLQILEFKGFLNIHQTCFVSIIFFKLKKKDLQYNAFHKICKG